MSAAYRVEDTLLGELRAVTLVDETAGSGVTLVPERGALVTSLVACGREWLYLDPATLHDLRQNVRGGVPVLFPSPGKLAGDRFARDGKAGAMKQHGFARTSVFRETSRGCEGEAWIELELRDSEATRAVYPWAFRLGLRFALRGVTLTIVAQVDNAGAEPLPCALGYHPYFAVPRADKARSAIPTRATRAWDNVRKEERAVGDLDLSHGEVDLHLINHGSSGATLSGPWGAVALAGHFSRWVVWTLPERDFVCLEPWTAPGDALNSGEDLTLIAPGASRSFALALWVGPTAAPLA